MKIAPSPPLLALPKGAQDLRSSAAAVAPAVPRDELAFDRTLEFGHDSHIDEAAVVLVDLSVLVYSSLEVIRAVFDRAGLLPLAAFDAGQDRALDLAWLQHQADLRAQVKTLKPPDASMFVGTLRDPKTVLQDAVKAFARDMPVSEESIRVSPRNRHPRVIAFRHGSRAYVVFRGTAGLGDWGRDAMVWPARRLPLRHAGFEHCWNQVKPLVQDWLARETLSLGTKPTLHIGGHSLGGAMATLAAIDLGALGYPIARVVTIGCPRPGGRGLRAAYQSTDAAKDDKDAPRKLPDVSTRFVHGSDIFATILPPPPLAVHVCPPQDLRAEDPVPAEDFIAPGGMLDASVLMNLIGGSLAPPASGYMRGLVPAKASTRTQLRTLATQIGMWSSMLFPATPWTRALMPFAPFLAEQTRVMCFQHKSARYMTFFPGTPIRDAMNPAPAAPPLPTLVPPSGALHIVKAP